MTQRTAVGSLREYLARGVARGGGRGTLPWCEIRPRARGQWRRAPRASRPGPARRRHGPATGRARRTELCLLPELRAGRSTQLGHVPRVRSLIDPRYWLQLIILRTYLFQNTHTLIISVCFTDVIIYSFLLKCPRDFVYILYVNDMTVLSIYFVNDPP